MTPKFDPPCAHDTELVPFIDRRWIGVECARCGAVTAKYRSASEGQQMKDLLFGEGDGT